MKSKNWLIYIIIVTIMVAIIASIIMIVRSSLNGNIQKLSNKIDDELEYLDKTTLAMINQLNNLKTTDEIQIKRTSVGETSQNIMSNSNQEESTSSSSKSTEDSKSNNENQNIEKYYIEYNSVLLRDTNTVDWNDLENQAENLYDSWVTITLDLNTMNVSSDDILSYNTNLDNLMISIKDKNKVNSAICLANLYSLVPKYMSETSEDQPKIQIGYIKSDILSAYSLLDTEKWNDITNLLGSAESKLTEFMNGGYNLSSMRQSKVNKAYVLLKELIKSSNEKNKDLFYLKYISLIQELEDIG
ncbi:MAG: hypothetical protein ACI4VC_05645 [Clostridia bacterium]